MKALKERNQVMVAIVGTVIAATLVLASMNLGKLPFLNPTNSYHADFANADGLIPGADVRVEGISVGKVGAVKVQGDHVVVDFTVQTGVKLGGSSDASIEVATVLGSLFMQVESAGPGQLRPGDTIPVGHTTVPYTLVQALDAFGAFSQQTDIPALQTSLRRLAGTLGAIAPADVKGAMNGLSSVAQTLAAKQNEISQILTAADQVTKTLNVNSGELVALLTQGDQFVQLLNQRQQVIGQLLADTASLGIQLRTLIARNGTQFTSLLSNLNTLAAVLAKDQHQLQQAVINLGQFSVNIANVSGSGPWLNLLSATAIEPDNILKACGANPNSSNGPCG